MAARKKLLLWTLVVIGWFFLHTFLLLLVLTSLSKNHGGHLDLDPNLRNKMEVTHPELSHIRLMTSEPPIPMHVIKSEPDISRVTGVHIPRQTSPEMYVIGSKKRTRLQLSLNNIMKTHERPPDTYYGFNVTRSEELPFDRTIRDNRFQECKDIKYDYDKLPTVSVVTPIHNEALSTLVRHVIAILLRTPNHLLKDIILVDDNSTFSYLGRDLDSFFRILDPRVKILRNKGREGLVVSRLHGCDVAEGEVVVFLDAHMEVGPGWSEPLLHRLNSQSALVVQPDVPAIDRETFKMDTHYGLIFRGGFGWDMRYSWYFLPRYVTQWRTSRIDPLPTPVLVGCAIAVRKEYFNSIGRFDPGLQIWGGEHFDLSFRVWTSGGRIETIPCSKVGHVFKSNNYSYGPKGKQYILTKNLMRVAEIWMDGYKDIVKAISRSLNGRLPVFTAEELESIEERRQLNRDLKCKDFTWFLEHIMPEVKIPSPEADYYGEITNEKSEGCFYVTDDGYIGITSACFMFRTIPENEFTLDKWGRLLHDNRCIGVDPLSLMLSVVDCPCLRQGILEFRWEADYGRIVYVSGKRRLCATHVTSVTFVHKGEQMVQALKCDSTNGHQQWRISYNLQY